MSQRLIVAVLILIATATNGYAAATKLGNIIFDNKSESRKKIKMAPAVFPHNSHEKIIKCDGCHPQIFIDKRGANQVTMQENISGNFCGSAECHNSPKAFPLIECKKCHIESK